MFLPPTFAQSLPVDQHTHQATQDPRFKCTGSDLIPVGLCRVSQGFDSERKVSSGTMSMVFMLFNKGTGYLMCVVFLYIKRRIFTAFVEIMPLMTFHLDCCFIVI